jgi:AraC family transcriptional activator of pobA
LDKADVFILEFTLDYFCQNDNDIELIFHNGLFCHFDINEVIEVSNHQIIQTQLELIAEEL